MRETVTVTIVHGVEGNSMYVDNYRVAGPKPWGGGTTISEWVVRSEDILKMINREGDQR